MEAIVEEFLRMSRGYLVDDDDEAAFWRSVRQAKKERRRLLGVNCPGCNIKEPKRTPTILLPGQRCRVCKYVDPRKDDLQ
jgi:hypothetical protein